MSTPAKAAQTASERMNFRVRPHVREAIRRAAAMKGMDESAFTLSAAYDKALATIRDHEVTVLKPEDVELFFAALDAPREPTEALKQAFARHKATIVSR